MDAARTRQLALDMLARREHTKHELKEKLVRKGCPEGVALEVVADLEATKLLSDERFAESVVRVRRNRGYGPLRIRKELQDKGVDHDCIERCLDAGDPEWVDVGRQARRKRFGDKLPKDYKERARQARFLQYRGFTYDQIQGALNPNELD